MKKTPKPNTMRRIVAHSIPFGSLPMPQPLIRFVPLLIPILTSALILSGCGSEAPPPAASTVAEAGEDRATLSRRACHEAWVATLESPDTTDVAPADEWPVEEMPNGTIRVEVSAQVRDTLGEMVEGRWECVLLPEGDGVRMVSLLVIDL